MSLVIWIVSIMVQTALQDIRTERETYQQSRVGLDGLYQDTRQKLLHEAQLRMVRLIFLKLFRAQLFHLLICT